MTRPRINIWLKYAMLHDKTHKDIAIGNDVTGRICSMKTAYRILNTGKLSKLDIAKKLVDFLQIPYPEFDRYWRERNG